MGFLVFVVLKVDENRRFDKIAGSDFERPQAGPEGVEHREVRNNPLGDAKLKRPASAGFFNFWFYKSRFEPRSNQ